MLFTSNHFAVFFVVVVGVYFALRQVWARRLLLLVASYYFYMAWNPWYAGLILASTLVDWVAALQMEKAPRKRVRQVWLGVSLASNLGMLFAFKYFNFAVGALQLVADAWNVYVHLPTLNVLLPVGISFYTFQTLSYTIEVYWRRLKPERNPLTFALYVAFFPQLVAGPIERAAHLLPQFQQRFRFEPSRVASGLRLFAWGLFLKAVLADRLAPYVDQVYSNPATYDGLSVWLATFFFTFQIYGDFAGYSAMAIGAARILGYDLMQNFRQPYFARSVRQFWGRWHISLSTWFRDYVYIPLGGRRAGRARWYFNLFAVFFINGLWHGASWTFVIYAFLQGTFVVGGLLLAQGWKRFGVHPLRSIERRPSHLVRGFFQALGTFCLVCLARVFFRAQSLDDAWHVLDGLTHLGPAHWYVNIVVDTQDAKYPHGPFEILFSFVLIAGVLAVDAWNEWAGRFRNITTWPWPLRWAAYLLVVFLILVYGKFGQHDFIYFQF